MKDEVYDIFDQEGKKIIGKATYTEVHAKGLLHQTAAVLVWRDKNKEEMLIQRRSEKAKQSPGVWQGAAAGHVRSGKKPDEDVRKELREEIFDNIDFPDLKIKKLFQFIGSDLSNNNEIVHVFETIYGGPFSYSKEEVSEPPKWIRFDELINDMKEEPDKYAPALQNIIREYIKFKN